MDQPKQPNQGQGQEIKIKAADEVLAGKYANMMQVAHNKEEFILDFMNLVPPQGTLNSRIMTSPGHAKRILKTLQENIKRYEDQYGTIDEAESPKAVRFPNLG
ncbi:DUF3467 domain-containing protein [Patescibacteria group bacterium]